MKDKIHKTSKNMEYRIVPNINILEYIYIYIMCVCVCVCAIGAITFWTLPCRYLDTVYKK